MSNTKGDIHKAFLEVQRELRNPKFDSVNPHFKSKYASLGEVLATVKPVLNKYGLVLLQSMNCDNKVVAINTKILHVETGGEIDFGTIALPIPERGDNVVQAMGAVITYLRRYSILTALGVVGEEDDDAESVTQSSASNTSEAKQRAIAMDSFRNLGVPTPVLKKLEGQPLDKLRALYPQLKAVMQKVEKTGLKATLVDVLEYEDVEDVVASFNKNSYAYLRWLEGVRDKRAANVGEVSKE